MEIYLADNNANGFALSIKIDERYYMFYPQWNDDAYTIDVVDTMMKPVGKEELTALRAEVEGSEAAEKAGYNSVMEIIDAAITCIL